MRRLPVYFVLDVSESMAGEALRQLEDGLAKVIIELRLDPHALDTAFISVIAFAGKVRRLVALTEVVSFIPPKLPVGGGTSLGRALNFLMDEIEHSVVVTTPERKGDWKPIVFLLTDGRPTDDPAPAIERWQQKFSNRVTLVAVSIGRAADLNVLAQLTPQENVLMYDETDERSFAKFIQWVTQSVKARSRSVGDAIKEKQLPDLDISILKRLKLDQPLESIDEANVFFVSKCQKNKLPYITKYAPETAILNADKASNIPTLYRIVGCYPVSNTYFEMSSEQPNVATVDSKQLLGFPACPQCGNQIGFAMCDCGNTFCMDSQDGHQTCPWCNSMAWFGSSDGEDPGTELTRARG